MNTMTFEKLQYNELKERYPIIEEIKGKGLLSSIRFSDEIEPEYLSKLDKHIFDSGFIVGMKPKEKTLRTYMPLITEKSMIDSYIDILETSLSKPTVVSKLESYNNDRFQ